MDSQGSSLSISYSGKADAKRWWTLKRVTRSKCIIWGVYRYRVYRVRVADALPLNSGCFGTVKYVEIFSMLSANDVGRSAKASNARNLCSGVSAH